MFAHSKPRDGDRITKTAEEGETEAVRCRLAVNVLGRPGSETETGAGLHRPVHGIAAELLDYCVHGMIGKMGESRLLLDWRDEFWEYEWRQK